MRELWDDGRLAQSARVIADARKRSPDDPGLMLVQAFQLLEEGRGTPLSTEADVRDLVGQAVTLAGENAYVRLEAAMVFFRLGDMSASASHAVAAGERFKQLREPQSQAALAHVLGRLARAGGNQEAAEQQLRLAVSLDPSDAEYVVELADLLADVGSIDSAQQLVKDALVRHPGDERLLALSRAWDGRLSAGTTRVSWTQRRRPPK